MAEPGQEEAMQARGCDEDDWRCPICFEMIYKPCVNVCGHTFCFW
jgi:hypothetical protein